MLTWFSIVLRLVILVLFTFQTVKAEPGLVRFTENKGQWEAKILYKLRLNTGALFLESNRLTYHFISEEDIQKFAHVHVDEFDDPILPIENDTTSQFPVRHHAFYVNFKNANPHPKLLSAKPFEGIYNFFLGNQPEKWASKVSSFNEITYQSLYPGIDLIFGENEGHLKYEFVLQAGANPNNIALEFEGIDKIYIQNQKLYYTTSVNVIEELRPYSYQIIDGKKKEVASLFSLQQQTVSFQFPNGYDNRYPLIIDPVVVFSSYTGSLADNFGFTATYDESGKAHIGGIARGAGYPTTPGAFQSNYAGGVIQGNFEIGFDADMAISKFTEDGTSLIYSTYIGGSTNDQPHSLVIDKDSNLVILGRSNSVNFPVSVNAFDPTPNGVFDIVVVKLNKDGSALIGSTYVGGSANDGVNMFENPFLTGSIKYNYADDSRSEIIVDDSSNIYIAASTNSSNFPITQGAYQTSLSGGQDACVMKFNSDLSQLFWSTFLGGNNDDAAYSLVLDKSGNIITCGGTNSINFPITSGTLNSTFQGGRADGFVTKLNNSGSTILQSTYIGTNAYDQNYFVQLDGDENIYLLGQTEGNFLITPGTYNNNNSGQYIIGLSPNMSIVRFSTRIGANDGFPDISPTAFLVDNCRNIYLAGWGAQIISGATIGTAGLPTTPDGFQLTTDNNDFYFMVLSENASQLLYGSFFGGTQSSEHVDGGTSRFDKNGVMYEAVCAGCGGFNDFPTTPGVVSNTNNSQVPQRNCNMGIIKFQIAFNSVDVNITTDVVSGCSPLTVNFNGNGFQTDNYQWDFGNGQTSNLENPQITYTQPGTYFVSLFGRDTSCRDLTLVDSSFTTIIVRNDSVSADFTLLVTGDCDSNTIFFTSITNNANDFLWDFGDGNTSSLPNPTHSYSTPGIFTVTFTARNDSACKTNKTLQKTVEIVVGFNNSIQVDVDTICPNLAVNFTNTHQSVNSDALFFWDFGDGFTSNESQPSHLFENAGTFTVSLITIDSSFCNIIDTSIKTIVVLPNNVLADFELEKEEFNLFEPIIFKNLSQNASNYFWDFGDGNSATEFEPTHEYRLDGTYIVCLSASNNFGCEDSICKSLKILFEGIVDVANAFSPNGDGENDVLFVKGFGITELEFKIYNRWGELVFESNNINIGWDGSFKGRAQEAEVYVYTLKAKFENGVETSLRKGNITLLR